MTDGNAEAPSAADPARGLVCVYGALRSGTTLFRLMLDAHPRIHCPGETDYLFDHVVRDAAGAPARIDLEALEADRIFRAARIPHPAPGDARTGVAAMVAALRNGREGTLALMAHRELPTILDLLPGVRIIHMLRDPRDVARSSIGMLWAGNVYHGVDHWIATERGWQANAGRIAPGALLTVRYEDLILRPEETLAAVCRFAGEDYAPEMLTYHRDTTYEPPDASLTEQWRRKLAPREIGLVEGKLGPMLADAGYAPSGHPAVIPGRAGRLALWVANKRSVWGRMIGRFGLRDMALRAIGKRLGMTSLVRAAQRRMDEKVVKYLK